ncbi:phytoene desaturase family protein [Jatrophihabitans sp. DSM 45814]
MSRRRRRVSARTDRVVIVGAGLGGLAAALRLAGAQRSVRVVESGTEAGGLMGRWRSGGYQFDTGPTVLTMPELIDDALACVGENRSDWLDLIELTPSYRAQFADDSVLQSFSNVTQMADEVARVCGPYEAHNYLRLVDYLTALYRAEFDTYLDRNLDSPSDLFRPQALSLLRLGALRSLDRAIGSYLTDDRLRRLFTFQSLYAGVAPQRARAIYGVIAYLDSISGVWFPKGGMYQVAAALAGAAQKHGVQFSYGDRATSVEFSDGRARAVTTAGGERIAADVVIINCDLESAYRDLLPPELGLWRNRRPRYSPSAFVWHVGSRAPLPHPAHHTISFGSAWSETFEEIIGKGRLMSDPSLLITSPTVTDPSRAEDGRHTYFVLAPSPNMATSSIDWSRVGPRYVEEIAQVLASRGFDTEGAFSSGLEVSRTMTPSDWRAGGLAAGSPFALAHTLAQTGPMRHPTQHPKVDNLLFCGAGVQPGVGIPTVLLSGKLAAQRVTG